MHLPSRLFPLLLCCLTVCSPVELQEEPDDKGVRYAVLLIGLSGDEEHRQTFEQLGAAWIRWLRNDLEVSSERLIVLAGRPKPSAANDESRVRPATRESLEARLADLEKRLNPQDALWVFFLGHANHDDEHAFFHLPGPDINENDVAELFAPLKCREQVFWLTHACSGWFLEALSQKGRVVITATAADRAYNETEFPHALATVLEVERKTLDRNEDQDVSVAEMFAMVSAAVEGRFRGSELAPTEHAQLDDNGDGVGTEADKLITDSGNEANLPVTGRVKAPDGGLASKIFLPRIVPTERTEESSNETRD